jgi:hypothetical protein
MRRGQRQNRNFPQPVRRPGIPYRNQDLFLEKKVMERDRVVRGFLAHADPAKSKDCRNFIDMLEGRGLAGGHGRGQGAAGASLLPDEEKTGKCRKIEVFDTGCFSAACPRGEGKKPALPRSAFCQSTGLQAFRRCLPGSFTDPVKRCAVRLQPANGKTRLLALDRAMPAFEFFTGSLLLSAAL